MSNYKNNVLPKLRAICSFLFIALAGAVAIDAKLSQSFDDNHAVITPHRIETIMANLKTYKEQDQRWHFITLLTVFEREVSNSVTALKPRTIIPFPANKRRIDAFLAAQNFQVPIQEALHKSSVSSDYFIPEIDTPEELINYHANH